MSGSPSLFGMSAQIVEVHEMLDSMRVRHQFGGAIALAWYRSPRATVDIDVNVTLPPQSASPVLGALAHLGVEVTDADRLAILVDGQARLVWRDALLDVFFATLPLHEEMADRARAVAFGPTTIPILSPEDLVICKAVFDRPKDWADIEAMIEWGTVLDLGIIEGWLIELLGAASASTSRLRALLVGRA